MHLRSVFQVLGRSVVPASWISCHRSSVDVGVSVASVSLRYPRLNDDEIRALWGPDHLLQDSLFFLKIVLYGSGCMFGVSLMVLHNG